jgi:hypothetical protein
MSRRAPDHSPLFLLPLGNSPGLWLLVSVALPALIVTPTPLPGKKFTLSVRRSIATLPAIIKLLAVDPGVGAGGAVKS